VDGTGSGSCPVAGSGISGVEPSSMLTKCLRSPTSAIRMRLIPSSI
jgi:hypothetical protein